MRIGGAELAAGDAFGAAGVGAGGAVGAFGVASDFGAGPIGGKGLVRNRSRQAVQFMVWSFPLGKLLAE